MYLERSTTNHRVQRQVLDLRGYAILQMTCKRGCIVDFFVVQMCVPLCRPSVASMSVTSIVVCRICSCLVRFLLGPILCINVCVCFDCVRVLRECKMSTMSLLRAAGARRYPAINRSSSVRNCIIAGFKSRVFLSRVNGVRSVPTSYQIFERSQVLYNVTGACSIPCS